jgi:hypothetical protein
MDHSVPRALSSVPGRAVEEAVAAEVPDLEVGFGLTRDTDREVLSAVAIEVVMPVLVELDVMLKRALPLQVPADRGEVECLQTERLKRTVSLQPHNALRFAVPVEISNEGLHITSPELSLYAKLCLLELITFQVDRSG